MSTSSTGSAVSEATIAAARLHENNKNVCHYFHYYHDIFTTNNQCSLFENNNKSDADAFGFESYVGDSLIKSVRHYSHHVQQSLVQFSTELTSFMQKLFTTDSIFALLDTARGSNERQNSDNNNPDGDSSDIKQPLSLAANYLQLHQQQGLQQDAGVTAPQLIGFVAPSPQQPAWHEHTVVAFVQIILFIAVVCLIRQYFNVKIVQQESIKLNYNSTDYDSYTELVPVNTKISNKRSRSRHVVAKKGDNHKQLKNDKTNNERQVLFINRQVTGKTSTNKHSEGVMSKAAVAALSTSTAAASSATATALFLPTETMKYQEDNHKQRQFKKKYNTDKFVTNKRKCISVGPVMMMSGCNDLFSTFRLATDDDDDIQPYEIVKREEMEALRAFKLKKSQTKPATVESAVLDITAALIHMCVYINCFKTFFF